MEKTLFTLLILLVVEISGRSISSSVNADLLQDEEEFGIKGKGHWNAEEEFGVKGSGKWMSEEEFGVKGSGRWLSEEEFGVKGNGAWNSEDEAFGVPGKGVWENEVIGSDLTSNSVFASEDRPLPGAAVPIFS